jgi:protein gp37
MVRLAAACGWEGAWPVNVWAGCTVEDQERADQRIPELLRVPARVRFLSCEPLIGPLDLQRPCTASCPNRRRGGCELDQRTGHRVVQSSEDGGMWIECACSRLNGIHWVICGGESGHGARPMNPDWARHLRDQCLAARVAFHFKQHGEYAPVEAEDASGPRRILAGAHVMERMGKHASGRVLDGRTWDEWPTSAVQVV